MSCDFHEILIIFYIILREIEKKNPFSGNKIFSVVLLESHNIVHSFPSMSVYRDGSYQQLWDTVPRLDWTC